MINNTTQTNLDTYFFKPFKQINCKEKKRRGNKILNQKEEERNVEMEEGGMGRGRENGGGTD